ncbi:MAG: cytochrome b/b6 domain-containing protein [Terriglobia bacterium]
MVRTHHYRDSCFQSQPDVSCGWGQKVVREVPAKFRDHRPDSRGGPAISFRLRLPVHDGRAMGTISPMSETLRSRHPALVRFTHWLVTLSFLALLVSGVEILISHPRFYWGETGNVRTPALFSLPIPASRSTVPTGYGYVLPDQNGWSRYLHFEAAWVAVLTGLLYVAFGFFQGHFRRNLLPAPSDLSPKRLAIGIARHLRFRRPSEEGAWSYNVLQRLTYLLVIFFLFPLEIWTGLAMSPAIASAFPAAFTVLGGRQSARTIHFFVSIFLVLFLLVHVLMVCLAGFRKRVGAMITGRLTEPMERA